MDDARYPVEEDPVDTAKDQPAGDDPTDVAQAAEDDHDQHEDRHVEAELLRRDHLEVTRPDRSGEPGEARAEREGEKLGGHEVDAHRSRGDLVLAHGCPGAADSREAQARCDHDRQEQDRDDEVVPGNRTRAEEDSGYLRVADRVHPLCALGYLGGHGLRLPPKTEEPIDDREGERQRDPAGGDPDTPLARLTCRCVPPAEGRALHARSPRAWPSKPVGLKTRMITSSEKTPTFSHWPPKYVTVSA